MRIGQAIGKVTLGKCHPSVKGAKWIIAAPLYTSALTAEEPGDSKQGDNGQGEPLVVYDERGTGTGSIIALSEGAEAAAPFAPDHKPIDAYNTAILDKVTIKLKL